MKSFETYKNKSLFLLLGYCRGRIAWPLRWIANPLSERAREFKSPPRRLCFVMFSALSAVRLSVRPNVVSVVLDLASNWRKNW